MKALIFIQTNDGQIRYKCDTFWSTSIKINHAKIYRDDQREIDDWITPYDYNIAEYMKKRRGTDDEVKVIENYRNAKMGYRTIELSLLNESGYSAKDDTIDSNLGPLIYTHQMIIDDSVRIVDIRKQIVREQKLNELL